MDMSRHLGRRALLRFTLPSIAMMILTSVYGVVDGLFVSNCAGTTAFAAVNLIMPFIMILGTLGFMMGSGGSALVARTRGEGDDELANRYFSMIIHATLAAGIVLAVVGAVLIAPSPRRWAPPASCWSCASGTAGSRWSPCRHSCCSTPSRPSPRPPAGPGSDCA